MKKILSLFFILTIAFAYSSVAIAGSSTYYSKATANVHETGGGKVYISNAATDSPVYGESNSTTQNGSEQSHTYYLYAQPDEGYILGEWLVNNVSIGAVPQHAVTASSTDEKAPTEFTFTARFIKEPAVSVTSNDATLGSATINKLENAIGDQVTLTAALADPWAGGMGSKKWSKSHTFLGWFDSNGNKVSDQLNYTFTIDENNKGVYTAIFNWEQFVTGPGYYRIRWSYGQQFWALSGSYDPTPLMFSTHDSRKINGVLDLTIGEEFSNPATIMRLNATSFSPIDLYAEEKEVASGLTLEAQGVTTATVLKGKTLKLQTTHNVGFYKILYSSYQIASSEHPSSSEGYLYVNSDQTGDSTSDPDSYFEFEPLDLDHIDQFYFGAEPDESHKFDDAYWTTMYTSFPYECYGPDGVEAYIVTEISDNNEVIIEKIGDGYVPAYTPVLLKCQGLTAKENRLLPVWEEFSAQANSSNLLLGDFQLNESKDDPNKKTADSTMRIFGIDENGLPAFITVDDGTELEANRARLDVSGVAAPAESYSLKYFNDEQTGVDDIIYDQPNDNPADAIYDLMGRRVDNPVKGRIYISKGKKFIF